MKSLQRDERTDMRTTNRYSVISRENSESKLRMLGATAEKKLKDIKSPTYTGGIITVIKFKKRIQLE